MNPKRVIGLGLKYLNQKFKQSAFSSLSERVDRALLESVT